MTPLEREQEAWEHPVRIQDAEFGRVEAFAKCVVCGRMATRITKAGKIGRWRHA